MGKKKEEYSAGVDVEQTGAGESNSGVDVEVLEPEEQNLKEGHTPWNKYGDDIKFEALRKAMEEGKSVICTAREMGIGTSTVEAWLKELEEQQKVEMKAGQIEAGKKLKDKFFLLADGISTDKLEKASLKDIAVSMGIVADKWKEMVGSQASSGAVSLRIAWQDGAGAVELTTGEGKK